MAWDIEFTDELGEWWDALDENEQESIDTAVRLLEAKGPMLPYPYSSDVRGSRHGAMRELRIQHAGDPYRILYIFDPRRAAILLLGGNKTGDDRWYVQNIPRADVLYDEHLETLRKDGLL